MNRIIATFIICAVILGGGVAVAEPRKSPVECAKKYIQTFELNTMSLRKIKDMNEDNHLALGQFYFVLRVTAKAAVQRCVTAYKYDYDCTRIANSCEQMLDNLRTSIRAVEF